ncbi:MAG: hypothetical protein ACRYFW_04245 [Janthinobacterium lividum]
MEFDYRRSAVIFRPAKEKGGIGRDRPHGTPAFTLRYVLRRMPNHPTASARIGGEAFVAAFDTGQYGTVYADTGTQSRLVEAGAIARPRRDGDDAISRLQRWSLDGHRLPVVSHVGMSARPFAAARGTGIAELRIVTVGYGLLHRYRKVWDWSRGEIVFYPR